MKTPYKIGLFVLLPLILVIWLAVQGTYLESFTLKEESDILAILGKMFFIALVVENFVEVFIHVLRPVQFGTVPEEQAARTAHRTKLIALSLAFGAGLLVAFAGFRTLELLIEQPPGSPYQRVLFTWVDVLLTAGLIGGGSERIHAVIKTLRELTRTGLKRAAESKNFTPDQDV